MEENEFKNDCPNYSYIPTIVEKKRRIIAIGDLHGDYDLTIKILLLSKVIDNNLNWIGKDTVIVQTGDKVDGYRPINHNDNNNNGTADEDIKLLNLFYNLNLKAEKHGGAVYSLLGNHEIMNVLGDFRYVSKKSLLEFAEYEDDKIIFKDKFAKLSPIDRGIVARKYAFQPGNKYATFLGCANAGCIIIGSFLFVHAGIVPEFLDEFKIKNKYDLIEFNAKIRKWLLGKQGGPKGKSEENYTKNMVSNNNSPFWSRILGFIPNNINNNDQACNPLNKVLDTLKIGHMVVGHTPQMNGIMGTCLNEKKPTLYKIDIGASKAFNKFRNKNSIIQVLEILNDGEQINILH
ncbi:metallophosphatase/phosphoesterase [Hokovirus HKV1]|uniref:Metallophosphatase/phosphoesterase n=1 Tax=Hokovirus HKV1 TaxID=1977638 RepID=A0A1V0SFZ7_9VIRU|nr:metallophosphatase/phosphoesterase [Hokovirus HKV1]